MGDDQIYAYSKHHPSPEQFTHTLNILKGASMTSTPTLAVPSSSSITGDKVRNFAGEDLGKIKDLMIDLRSGSVRFAVVSLGGFLGMGDKLFAVPFDALTVDADSECFVLDADKAKLENAPGFDEDNWPDLADQTIADTHTNYYR